MAQAAIENKKGSGKNKKAATSLYEPERCERCGTAVIETRCKVLCTNCGYMRDCNDQW